MHKCAPFFLINQYSFFDPFTKEHGMKYLLIVLTLMVNVSLIAQNDSQESAAVPSDVKKRTFEEVCDRAYQYVSRYREQRASEEGTPTWYTLFYEGDLRVLEEFITAHPEALHVCDQYGCTLLHHLIKWYGSPQYPKEEIRALARHVLALGIDCKKESNQGKLFPLEMAVKKISPFLVELLLQYGADPEQITLFGETPLYITAYLSSYHEDALMQERDDEKRVRIAELLLAQGASPLTAKKAGKSPLEAAVRTKKKNMVALFLHDPRVIPSHVISVLKYIPHQERGLPHSLWEVIDTYLHAKYSEERADGLFCEPCDSLVGASDGELAREALYLKQRGAEQALPFTVSTFPSFIEYIVHDLTPLSSQRSALFYVNFSYILKLIPHATGYLINQENEKGRTALHIACMYQSVIQEEMYRQSSHLHVSCMGTSQEEECHQVAHTLSVVKALLENKYCHINKVDVNGDTALHLAARSGNEKVCELLLSVQADPLLKNNAGLTPIDEAFNASHAECLAVLRSFQQLSSPHFALSSRVLERPLIADSFSASASHDESKKLSLIIPQDSYALLEDESAKS